MNNPTEDKGKRIADSIGKILEDEGIDSAIIIYRLPGEESQDPIYGSFYRGHFYDTLKLVSGYASNAKKQIMSDLNGLM